jgi:hypothetical protein
MKIFKAVELLFLGSVLYLFKVATTVLTLTLSSAIAAVFVMLASRFASVQSAGAVPRLGYLASVGLSFILIFTTYIGARGAAHSRD